MIGTRSAMQRAPGGFNPDATSLISAQDTSAKTSWATTTSLEGVSESRRSVQRVFLTHVFSHVLLQDRAALGASGKSTRGDLGRRILFASIALLALAWIIVTVISFVGNAGLVSAVRTAGQDLSAVQNLGSQAPPADSLRRLDRLRQTLVELRGYQQNGPPLHLRWGLYAGGDNVFADARAIYFHAFDQVLFQHAKHNLMNDLQTYRGVPQPDADSGAAYDSLKTYLLTTSEYQRNSGLGEFLQNFLFKDWKRDLGEMDQDRSDLAAQQFAFYSSELSIDNPFPKNNDTLLVSQVRAYLNSFSGVKRLYTSMQASVGQKTKGYRFAEQHPEASDVLRVPQDVSGAFTADGWKLMDANIRDAKKFLQGEPWVLGTQTSIDVSAADLISQLQGLYDAEYIKQWRALLNSARLSLPYKDDADQAKKLRKLADNSSPVLELFCDVSDNTNVGSNAIKLAFQPVQQVVPPGCGAQKKYVQSSNEPYMKGLLTLQPCAQDLADAPENQREAKKAACVEPAKQALNAATQIKQVLTPDSEGHVDDTVYALLQKPIIPLQEAPKPGREPDPICGPFKALQSAYPFNVHSTRDITLDEFNLFFLPKTGVLSKAIDAHKNDLSLQGTNYVHALGSTTPIGPIFLRTLNVLYAIQLAVYPNGATNPRYEYSITAHLPDVGVFKTESLSFDGQTWVISGSGGTRKFVWPGNAQGATLSMDSGGGDIGYQSANGLWAVAHFLQVYKWQSSSNGYTIQGPLPGPGGQPATVGGKEVNLRFDVDFRGVPLFQAGFLSTYACSSMSK
jgi:type VI secretion system protein ImpL